jgi:hypothetical protein
MFEIEFRGEIESLKLNKDRTVTAAMKIDLRVGLIDQLLDILDSPLVFRAEVDHVQPGLGLDGGSEKTPEPAPF